MQTKEFSVLQWNLDTRSFQSNFNICLKFIPTQVTNFEIDLRYFLTWWCNSTPVLWVCISFPFNVSVIVWSFPTVICHFLVSSKLVVFNAMRCTESNTSHLREQKHKTIRRSRFTNRKHYFFLTKSPSRSVCG